MITIESNSGTEQDIVDAMAANGIKPEEVVAPEKEAKPAEDKSKSAAPGEPGEKIPAETGKESAATTEVVEDKSKEKPPEEQVVEGETPPEPVKKAKGGFQIKVDKLTKTVDLLQTQLDAKDGNEARLRRELEEAQAKLAELKPAEPETPKELVRPKRPTREQVEFDEPKYEALMDKYEEDLDAYHAAKTDRTVSDKLKAENETRQKERQEAAAAQAETEFNARRDKDRELYPDYGDLLEAMPKDQETVVNESKVIADYIMYESEAPIHLIQYLLRDYLENDEAEGNRLRELNDYKKLKAIIKIEEKLISEHGSKAKTSKVEAAEASATAAATGSVPEKKAPEVATPAKEKPKRTEVPEDPISPVGNSAAAKGKDLNEQMKAASESGDGKEFRRLLALQQQEKRAARA